MRLDQFLVAKFNLESRHQAQRLIAEGVVEVNAKLVTKNSFLVSDTDSIEIKDKSILKFVSRGGLKLEHALKRVKLGVGGMNCLDIGQSTGGFTDCLLKAGAKHVFGVEVGHGQLHESLRLHPQITSFEKTHVLDITTETLGAEKLDLIVMDVSFISIVKIFSHLNRLAVEGTKILSLVKPQFELGPSSLNKSGVVKDASLYPLIEARIREQLGLAGFTVHDYFESQPRGTDGNLEFFVFASKDKF